MSNGTDDTAAVDTYYEFLPSARAGYRPNRSYKGKKVLDGRSRLGVTLNVEGVPVDGGGWEDAEREPEVDLRMYGPGDVTGIDGRQVVRVEPEPNTSTFAPNYFPLVEFDRADLPWLFSPERAETTDGKARPWMALVVVERGHDEVSIEADGTKPLPALTTPAAQLPPVAECWAWAHVQVVGELSNAELERALTNPSKQVVSRLICPRNLDPNTRYTAAVVPTFEPGVRAGLGKEPYDASKPSEQKIRPAWDHTADGTVTLPVYHQWSFTTGDAGDFEALARKLEPTMLTEHGVGVREIDLTDPGPNAVAAPDGLTRKLGGALQSPGLEPPDYPETSGGTDSKKRAALRDLLNDPAGTEGLQDSDVPVVGPPIYGQWYLPEDAGWGLSETGVPEPPGVPESDVGDGLADYFHSWIHELNVDPKHRIPASYGTEVVQENQEQLMEAAWKQFGDLERANERIGSSQAGDLVGSNLSDRFEGVAAERFGSRVRDPVEFAEDLEAYQALQRQGLLSPDALAEDLLEGQPVPASGGAVDPVSGGAVDGATDGAVDGVTGDVTGGTGGTTSPTSVDWGGSTTAGGDGSAVDATTLDDTTVTRTGVVSDDRVTSGVGGAMAGVQQRAAAQGGDALGASKLGRGDPIADGAGAMAMVNGATQMARLAEVNSPGFRKLTHNGSKLAKGVEVAETAADVASARSGKTVTPDGDRTLSSRFGGGTAEKPPAAKSAEPPEPKGAKPPADGSAAKSHERGEKPTDGEGPPTTDWRVDDAGNVLTLEDAIDRLDGPVVAVPQTLIAVESVRDHCETADSRLSELDDRLTAAVDGRDGAASEAVASLTERPTVGDHCRAIGQNTGDALARQLGKLVAADPKPLADSFTAKRRDEVLARFESAHRSLVEAVDQAAAAVQQAEFDPQAVRSHVDAARAALADVESVLETVESAVDDGIPPGAGQQAAPTQPQMAVDATQLLDVNRTLAEPVDPTTALQSREGDLAGLLQNGYGEVPGMLDAGGWSKQAAAWRINPALLERDVELAPILAAPEFDRPMYRWLKRVDQSYLLPGAEQVPQNSIGAVETSSEFIESFMCGLNHEMGRELLWRKYPTDRRGTYFRRFWDYVGEDDQPDVQKMHRWRRSPLGDNRAQGISDNRVVLLVRGELLNAYPNTRIYAVKAVREDRADSSDATNWDRMPLLEKKRQEALEERRNGVKETLPDYSAAQLEQWAPKKPIFRGKLDPGITFLGFDLTSSEAEGETLDETDDTDDAAGEADAEEDYGWFFVLEEPVGETRFGLDVPSEGDYGSVPVGIEHGPEGNRSTKKDVDAAEHGWSGLSWGHLVDSAKDLDAKTHVSVTGDNPAGGDGEAPWAVVEGESWTEGAGDVYEYQDAAEWGANSAHMANVTWQLPVRICIHGDDILPDMTDDDSTTTVTDTFARQTLSDRALGGED